MAGAVAVLGAATPPVTITATIGTGRWNDTLQVIEIDPQVLTWPAECQQFIGAHEAAHVNQKPIRRRPIVGALAAVLGAYCVSLIAGCFHLGVTDVLLAFAIQTTCYTAVLLTVLLEVVTLHSRRREYQADQIAAAAVGVAGLLRWRAIVEQGLTRSNRALLAVNAAMGLRTHPSWRRRVAAAHRHST